MANGNGNGKKPEKTYTSSYTIDGKSYDFAHTGDKKPSAASILATFKKHHPQSAQSAVGPARQGTVNKVGSPKFKPKKSGG